MSVPFFCRKAAWMSVPRLRKRGRSRVWSECHWCKHLLVFPAMIRRYNAQVCVSAIFGRSARMPRRPAAVAVTQAFAVPLQQVHLPVTGIHPASAPCWYFHRVGFSVLPGERQLRSAHMAGISLAVRNITFQLFAQFGGYACQRQSACHFRQFCHLQPVV